MGIFLSLKHKDNKKEGFFMFYPENLPYMKMVNKIINLPKGHPVGKGNLIFLFSNDRNDSFRIINDESNLKTMNQYKFYFFNLRYRGKINGKVYNINHIPEKRDMKKEVIENTGLQMFPLLSLDMSNDNRNCFFDMSEYLHIFFSLTEKVVASRKIEMFWKYLKSIINSNAYEKYSNKYILINIDSFKDIKGPLKKTMNNPVFVLYYTMFRDYTLLSDVNIDFILYTGRYVIRINPSMVEKDSYRKFMLELKKIYKNVSVDVADSLDDEKIMKDEREELVSSEIKKSFNFTGDEAISGTITKLPDKKEEKNTEKETVTANEEKAVNKKIDDAVKASNAKAQMFVTPKSQSQNQVITKMMKTDVENTIESDPEIIKELYKVSKSKAVPKSVASSKRDEELRKKQEDLVVNNMTVRELKRINSSHMDIPTKNVSNVMHTTNENMKTVRFSNFNQTYIDKVMPKDITNSILSLSEKSLPLFIRNIKVEDTSNELNYVDTYTIEFEDANRQRSMVKIDIPKFIDGKFMWLGGNKKLIINQNFLLPIVKTGPNTVQIVTNYNKMFVFRDDVKTLDSIEKLQKVVKEDVEFQKCFRVGNAFEKNRGYITTIEYDELSKLFTSYRYKDCVIMFDQSEAEEYAKNHSIDIKQNQMFIGVDKDGPIFIDYDKQTNDFGETIVDLIFRNASDEANEKAKKVKSSKRLMYAKLRTMEKMVPVMILISFWEGFTTVLKKMNASYRLSEKSPKDLSPTESTLRFKDCYFIYQDNAITSLLLNGMRQMKTENYNFADMDTREPYLDVFKKIYGKVSIANALDNSYEFSIDPITKEVLEDMNLPTNIVDVLIYAVKLLADNQYSLEINEGLSRVRSIEQIPAILYDTLAKNYITYKNSNGRKKFSVPRDAVIKKLLEMKNVEDYSTLNPILELERTHTITAKGWRGINLDDSYTIEKRSYDPSMVGIIGTATSPDGQCGVQRTLTLEPKIKSVRGYVDITNPKDYNNLKDVNLFSPGELAIPLGATRDDPVRIGHAIKQSKHVIPVKKSSPVLISNGVEESCRFDLSSDFVVNAKEDGKVVEYDEESNIMIVEYKSGNHQAINLAPTIVKNGGGGFWESNILITNLKVGDKFKANDALAWNKDFFQNNKLNGCRMNMGTLTKVAIMSTYDTHQDATFITEKLSKDAASEMCFQRSVVVGKNANVSFMARVGDNIEIGQSLIQFDTSFEDNSLNEFLSALSKDPRLEKEIMDSSRNNIKSKVAGVIEDIKIYSTVDIDELSPSLARIVKNYYNKINRKKKLLSKYDPEGSIVKCGMLLAETTGKVEPNKFGVIRGQKVEDSVLIEFYIKHTELLEVGSKIA